MPAPNRVILGVMNFGPPGPKTVRETSLDVYKQCLDLFQSKGYDEIDTARVYAEGKQEDWSVQAGVNERGLKIATKWYPFEAGAHKPEVISQKIDESLQQLQRKSVDIWYLHAADRSVPFQDTLEAVDAAHKAGKFKELGLSNFTAAEVAEICMIAKYNGWVRPTVYQGPYNVINRTSERDLLPVLRRFGLQYIIYNPIAGGLLTGKVKGINDIPTEGRFSDAIGPVGAMYRGKYFQGAIFDGIRKIEEAGEKHGLKIKEIAFRWVVHHSQLNTPVKGTGGNDAVLIGASNIEQLQSNLDELEKGPLPQDVVEACEAAWAGVAGVPPVYYHGQYKYTYDTLEAIYGEGRK